MIINTVHLAQFTMDTSTSAPYLSDDVHSFSVFAHHKGNDSPKDDKYFTWLPVFISPSKTIKVLMQVVSAATCNTLPSTIYRKISEAAPLQPSHAKIFPYSGMAIYLLGKVSLACEGVSYFETLEFQVMDSNDIPGKQALISGKDNERLGLIKFHTPTHLGPQQLFTLADLQPKRGPDISIQG